MKLAFLLAPLALAAAAAPLAAQSLGELQVGHWVRVKGALDAAGRFCAGELEVLAPADEVALVGTVTKMLTPTRFLLLGQEVKTAQETQWRGLAAGDLTGARIKVVGDYHGPRNLSAESISRRDPGRDALEGRVDELRRGPAGLELRILQWTVLVPQDAPIAAEQPLGALALAPYREFAQVPTQQRDEDDEFRGTLRLGDLRIGGLLEYRDDVQREQDLNGARPDKRSDREMSARLEGVWEPHDSLFALASVRLRDYRRIDEDDPDVHDTDVQLSEGYLYWRDAFGLGWDVQLGRQDFDERREWLYDQNLDALRFVRSTPALRLELSLSTNLDDASPRDEDSGNWIAYLSNNDFERHLAVYALLRDDLSSPDHGLHTGVRAYGDWLPHNDSWLDLAWYSGESAGASVGAPGFDLGTTWTPWEDGPWFVAGWAFGAGRGASGTFRQTGLNDNTDRFGGVTAFQYYGELFDPELANLSVLTLGVGAPLLPRTSLDLVAHRYDQDEAVDRVLDTGLRRRPDGVHTALGYEVDAVLGVRLRSNWMIESVVGWFTPGDAYPGADDAWLYRLQLRYRF